jgi:hypothetical protein
MQISDEGTCSSRHPVIIIFIHISTSLYKTVTPFVMPIITFVFLSLCETVMSSSALLALLGHDFELRLQPSLLSLHAVIDLFAA